MKKQQILRNIIGFGTAMLACAAVMVVNPTVPSPVPGGIGQETEDGTGFVPEAGNPEDGDGGEVCSPLNDREAEVEKFEEDNA